MYVRKYFDLLVPWLTFRSSGLETSMRPWKVWIYEFKETRNATRLSKKRGKKRDLSIPHSDLQEAISSATRKEWPLKQLMLEMKTGTPTINPTWLVWALHWQTVCFKLFGSQFAIRLDFRRLPGPVFDPPRRERERVRRELFRGMSAGSFSRTAAGNRA